MLPKHWTQQQITGSFLVLLLLFMLVYHFFGYFGHYGYDDIWYGRLAKRMADGVFHLNDDHYTYRWGLILPLALSYKLFGVNDFASALPSMLVTLGTLLLVRKMARKQSLAATLLALSMYLLYSWSIYYSDKLMPDIFVAFGFTAAFFCLYQYRFSDPKHPYRWAFLFATSLLFGFLSKATLFLGAPVFFAIFLSDLFRKKHISFWLSAAAFSLLLGAAYFAFISIKTGSPFYRFEAIKLNSYFNECSYDQLPLAATLKRIGYQYFLVFTRFGLIMTLVFGVVGVWQSGLRKLWAMDNETHFFQFAFLMAILSVNFMTISFEAYVPMCPDPRHNLFLTPLAALAAAPIASRFFFHRENRMAIAILLAIFTGLAFYNRFENRFFTYIPLLVLLLSRSFFPKIISKNLAWTFVLLFIGILWIQPIQSMIYAQKTGYTVQRQLIYDQFKKNDKKRLILTNPVQRNFGEYLMEFDTSSTRFMAYGAEQKLKLEEYEEIYILTNEYARILCGMSWDQVPKYLKSAKHLYQKKGIDLYQVENYEVLKKN